MRRASLTSKYSAFFAALVMVAPLLGQLAVPSAQAAGGPPGYDPDSCANGPVGSPDTTCNEWINGNLNDKKAHYAEGESVAYRAKLSNLTPGDWTLTIGYDYLESGKHAIDYLTTYNRTVTGANPCDGIATCNQALSTTLAIPKDTGFAPPSQVNGVFTLFGATLKSASGYTHSSGETTITVTFTVGAIDDPVLAWGGHIASRADWGAGNSAAAISGSPFHMRVKGLNGQGGNKDMQLSAQAVIFPATVTVVKVAAPKGTQTFPFTATNMSPTTFTLADDQDNSAPFDRQVFSVTDFETTKTITENVPAGWSLAAPPSCTGTAATVSGASVSIKPAEADTVTCTFSNVKNPTITVMKTADPTSVAEPGGAVRFSVIVHNDSPVENVTLVTLNDAPYGDITKVAGQITETDCKVGGTIAPGADYACAFTANVVGDAGAAVRDVVTATARDARNAVLTDDDDAVVEITDVVPLLQVDKSVSPGELKEPGGLATYKVDVTNLSEEELTLTTLDDDKFGPLAGKGDCAVGQKIAPSATYTCTFSLQVNGNAGTSHVNTVTGKGIDNEGNEAVDTGIATIQFTDVLPALVVDKSVSPSELPEPGGTVTYTVVVTNPEGAPEDIVLTTLQDDKFGDLNGQGTCNIAAGVTLAAGAKYTCTFDKDLVGDAPDTHLNTVTATVRDDDGNTMASADDAVVTFSDVLPTIQVEKTANPTTVPEPGGDVTFTVKVINPAGAAEPVTITSLIDQPFGNLAGRGTCLPAGPPLTLAPGGVYTCTFSVFISGAPRETKTDTVIGKAVDDEDNIAEDDATASVLITDVLPEVLVEKTAEPTSVPETGDLAAFTVRVRNPAGAVENIFLSELTDSVYGDLTTKGCDLTPPVVLERGDEFVCTFTAEIKGEAGGVHRNTVTAVAADDEENRDTATDDADVTLTDVIPTIVVTKAALPETLPEPGGNVTYAVSVTNTSLETVTITQLVDDTGNGPVSLADKPGDCLDTSPVTILPSATYSCAFSAPVNGEAGSQHPDTVTATARDNEGNDAIDQASATVTLTDVAPVIQVSKGAAPSEIAEPGGTVKFTVVVTNASPADAVTLTSLTDSVYGDLIGPDKCTLATIPVGESYTCEFTGPVSGNAGSIHENTVTAQAIDNDGTSTPQVSDNATVTVLDVAPAIVVDKLPSTNEIAEPGGTVDFTVTVTNPGTAEDLTLTSLTDSVYGDLNGKGNCAVPQTLAQNGGQYTCTFPGGVQGDAGVIHTNTVTGVANDDDGSEVSDTALATVTVLDVEPTVIVAKAASPPTLPEPGGTATFTVVVTNPPSAVEPIQLTDLEDSVYGDLNGEGTCALPQDLAPGATYTCSFEGKVAGNGGDTHTNEVTGTAIDNEENTATDSDTADVTIADVLPSIRVNKTAGVSTVHSGDSVTFTYAVHNLGIEPLSAVTVTDDQCSPVTQTGGDTDGNELLDLTEAWTFTCTAEITGTTTNTATAVGKDDEGNTATDTDTATVSVVDPRIVIDKVAALTQVSVGDSVTYTYTVTNPGNAPLADVTVTDDKCGPVTQTGGDTNNDGLLDPGEAWKFTCTAILSSPGQISNTGTVTAKDPIGLEVSATDTAIVSVLEVEVLPAVETPGVALLPAKEAAPDPTLPVTGANLMRWITAALALIAGGSLLRKSRDT